MSFSIENKGGEHTLGYISYSAIAAGGISGLVAHATNSNSTGIAGAIAMMGVLMAFRTLAKELLQGGRIENTSCPSARSMKAADRRPTP
jgi:hypothetical protein